MITVVAPYPENIQEGFMGRIGAIDHQLPGKRIYVNFNGGPTEVTWRDALRAEIGGSHAFEVLRDAEIIYVHTLHLAEHVIPWLGKAIVDIHGITPEEEVMLGRPFKDRYEKVEREVLTSALRCVAVSDAMIDHYAEKYPDIKPKWITLPIYEQYPDLQEKQINDPVKVVYAGNTEVWQNILAMLEIARCTPWASYAFYSNDYSSIRHSAERLGISNVAFAYATKDQLAKAYQESDFGLILRDDSPVNRVACPTKLGEYLSYGVIPVVRTPHLGDFIKLGYRYVTEDEFRNKQIPDFGTRQDMARENLSVMSVLANKFYDGIKEIRKVIE